MALTKSAITVLASTSVAAGTTKASPVAGSAIDCTGYHGGELTYKITNGASAPGAGGVITFQDSHNGTDWYDYHTPGSGDTVANSVTTASITLTRGVMYLRAIAYGNTTNAVTVESYLQAVTAV